MWLPARLRPCCAGLWRLLPCTLHSQQPLHLLGCFSWNTSTGRQLFTVVSTLPPAETQTSAPPASLLLKISLIYGKHKSLISKSARYLANPQCSQGNCSVNSPLRQLHEETRVRLLCLPKIFSCRSNTVLYSSVSLNQDFSSLEEKIFTATFSPCHCPLQTSPYRPFPGGENTQSCQLTTAQAGQEQLTGWKLGSSGPNIPRRRLITPAYTCHHSTVTQNAQ